MLTRAQYEIAVARFRALEGRADWRLDENAIAGVRFADVQWSAAPEDAAAAAVDAIGIALATGAYLGAFPYEGRVRLRLHVSRPLDPQDEEAHP